MNSLVNLKITNHQGMIDGLVEGNFNGKPYYTPEGQARTSDQPVNI
ncbi:MAG: hypothetical protein ACK4GL_12895 [Flavobacteriales bacterium]